jgi:hypothetical protein
MNRDDIAKFKLFLTHRGMLGAYKKNAITVKGCSKTVQSYASLTAFLENYTGPTTQIIDQTLTWALTPERSSVWRDLHNDWKEEYLSAKHKPTLKYKSIW